jgi:hypothetical protein
MGDCDMIGDKENAKGLWVHVLALSELGGIYLLCVNAVRSGNQIFPIEESSAGDGVRLGADLLPEYGTL